MVNTLRWRDGEDITCFACKENGFKDLTAEQEIFSFERIRFCKVLHHPQLANQSMAVLLYLLEWRSSASNPSPSPLMHELDETDVAKMYQEMQQTEKAV